MCFPDVPIESGRVVAVLARVLGFWWLNACRIVSVVDEDGPGACFGFAYGTLPGHVEAGEERFLVEWDPSDDSVWYDLSSFSRPNGLLSRLGEPYARRQQQAFAPVRRGDAPGRRAAPVLIGSVAVRGRPARPIGRHDHAAGSTGGPGLIRPDEVT